MKNSALKKLLLVISGSVISAYGIDLAIHAGFGGATLAVLWQGISSVFHISYGTASLAVAAVMIIFCFFYDRKQIYWGTLIYQIIYSAFVDIFAKCVFYTESKIVNFALMLLGITVFAIGTAIYSFADFGRGSYEALTFAIADKNGFQVRYVRIALDAAVVIVGVLLGGKFGLCTVFTVLLSGFIIQFTLKILNKIKNDGSK